MTTQRLRVGFLGGVRHASPYATTLATDPRVEIVGVAEQVSAPEWIQGAARELASQLGVAWTTDLDSFAGEESLDLAVVCTEPTRHADVACIALTAGRNVCVDKPIATTLAGARRVADAAASAVGLCAVVNRTFSPALRRLRSWTDAGNIGLPRHVDVEFLTSLRTFATDVEDPRLVVDQELSGGGELRNFLGYAVDAIRYLTGLEIAEVYAETSNLFNGPHAEHGVEDAGVVSMLLQHGVTATATIARVPAVPTIGPAHSAIRLIGSHGYATADDEHPRVLRFDGDAVSAVPVDGGGGRVAVDAFFHDLIERVLCRDSAGYSVLDACAGVQAVDAAYRSSATGRNIVLRHD